MILPIPKLENVRQINQKLWFEYHCNESHDSPDAQVWYHSHQQCIVIAMVDNDGLDIFSQNERFNLGHQLIYRVKFNDGLEWDVFEDELLDSNKNFQRPDPPKGKFYELLTTN